MNTENNKIIAVFMGLSYCEKYQFEGWYKNHEHNERVYDLNYDFDWNWLMEVVEKIESLGFWTEFRTHKNVYRFVIGDYDFETKPTVNIASKLKIEAIYNACFEFVKWYNQQN